MSNFLKPGLSLPVAQGGTGISIITTDPGSILIGDGQGFILGEIVAGANVTITPGPGTLTISTVLGSYTLPPATSSILGGVKIGANVFVALDGTISVADPTPFTPPYTLPIASGSVLGGIKVGANLSIDGSGVLSGVNSYTLPIASASVLGGIKVGSNLSIDGSGVLSGAAPFTLPIASASTLGGVKIGANVSVAGDGTISVTTPYTLPIASSSVLGGVKVGSGLQVALDGTLSTTGAGSVTSVALSQTGPLYSVSGSPVTSTGTLQLNMQTQGANTVLAGPASGPNAIPTMRSLVATDIPNISAAKITTGVLLVGRGGTGLDGSVAQNGQLLIGNGTGFSLANITAGGSITVTNTAGGITISAVGGSGGGIGAVEGIEYVIDGGGSVIPVGVSGDISIPYACTITACVFLANLTTSAVVDIWKSSFSGYPPTQLNTITDSNLPTITNSQKQQNNVSGWTTSLAAGDCLRFYVESCTAATLLTIALIVVRN